MYCSDCKKELNINETGERDWATTFILSLLMGFLGLHRFYTGYIGIGIAQALTLGGLGLWSLIDWISICTNNYRDYENKMLKNYIGSLGIGAMAVIFIYVTLIILFMSLILFAALKLHT